MTRRGFHNRAKFDDLDVRTGVQVCFGKFGKLADSLPVPDAIDRDEIA
jgi:hypothetical protein